MIFATSYGPTYAYTGNQALRAERPTIVFVHGALNDHSVFTLAGRWFAHHGWNVLALDQPGHMRSVGPVLPTIEALGAWLLDVLDAADLPRAYVVGHSMGSLIALEAAAQQPDRVTGLCLVGSAIPMHVSPALLEAAAHRPLEGIEWVNNLSISTWASKPGYPGPGVSVHGSGRALMRRVLASNPSNNLFLHDFSLCNAYWGADAALPRLRSPVQVIAGRRDMMTPPKGIAGLVESVGARLALLDTGHAIMQEDPLGFLEALRSATHQPG